VSTVDPLNIPPEVDGSESEDDVVDWEPVVGAELPGSGSAAPLVEGNGDSVASVCIVATDATDDLFVEV